MYVMKLDGTPMDSIAVFFSFSRKHIWAEIKAIPEAEKRRIERSMSRGQVA